MGAVPHALRGPGLLLDGAFLHLGVLLFVTCCAAGSPYQAIINAAALGAAMPVFSVAARA